PTGDDLDFLLRQALNAPRHKEILFDPATGDLTGVAGSAPGAPERLAGILGTFSQGVTAWLKGCLPRYAHALQPDRGRFHPEEEATRALPYLDRNDLLHLDAFPDRPSWGRRILCVHANLNPTEPRIWVTGEPFARLLSRFGARAGLPGAAHGSWMRQLG